MYRLLAAKHDGVRERRDQLTHPAYAKPELLAAAAERAVVVGHQQAARAGEVDVLLPLRDPRRLQPLRRRLEVQHRETGPIAEALIAQAIEQQQIARGQLTVHADRGAPMTLQAGRVPARRSRRHQDPQPALHLDRQPLLGGALQDAQVPARVPGALRLHRARPRVLPRVLRLVQQRAPPLRDQPDDPGRASTTDAPRKMHADRQPRPRRGLRGDARAVHQPRTDSATGPDRRVDQQADDQGGRSLNNRHKVSHRT